MHTVWNQSWNKHFSTNLHSTTRHFKHSSNFKSVENVQSLNFWTLSNSNSNFATSLSRTTTKLESREFLPNWDFTFRFIKHTICITDQCHLTVLSQCNTRALGVHRTLPRWIYSESESQIHSTEYGDTQSYRWLPKVNGDFIVPKISKIFVNILSFFRRSAASRTAEKFFQKFLDPDLDATNWFLSVQRYVSGKIFKKIWSVVFTWIC